jgi:hypothetical protein
VGGSAVRDLGALLVEVGWPLAHAQAKKLLAKAKPRSFVGACAWAAAALAVAAAVAGAGLTLTRVAWRLARMLVWWG